MSLAGKAAVVIWNDVTPEARAGFVAWHNREHMAERIGIPGFRRGRRFRSADAGGPEFLTLYELSDGGVLNGPAYLARLDAPSAWTQTILPQFRNTVRSPCRVEVSIGAGSGGFLSSARLAGELPGGPEALARFRDLAGDLLRRSAELLGVHLLARDAGPGGRETAETRLRGGSAAMPATVVLAEGTAGDAVTAAAAELTELLARFGLAAGDAVTGTYRLDLCMRAGDQPAPGPNGGAGR